VRLNFKNQKMVYTLCIDLLRNGKKCHIESDNIIWRIIL
jgi:hypothetical protein